MDEVVRLGSAEAAPADVDRIVFHDACYPGLRPGRYSVDVTQEIHVPTGVEKSVAQLAFRVAPSAATFNSADIHGLYPPDGSEGGYAGTLPHVVFNRRTLPWECELPGTPFTGAPWLALLLLRAQEVPPTPLEPGEPGDPPAPPLLALPARQFEALMPRPAQLRALAHVRQVDTRHKEVQAVNDRGWFSVVVGNRVVREGAYHAYLVALPTLVEPLQGQWAGAVVRLPVLAQWRFVSNGSEGFAARLLGQGALGDRAAFRDDDPWLRRPPLPPAAAGQEPALRALVEAAHEQGHAAFVHAMRDGAARLSWYRGPLVPVLHAQPAVRDLVSCADAVLQYDPRTGMLDTSYAAAWQLGRLLALQNPAFSLALHRARRQQRAYAQRLLDEPQASTDAGSSGETAAGDDHPEDEIAAFLLGAGGRALGEAIAAASEPRQDAGSATPASAPTPSLHAADPPPEPVDALRWLARLVLLHGVPLRYLVPDEAMLPPGSLRSFMLDPYWVQVLVQGACSLGEAQSNCSFVDQALRSLSREDGSEQGLAAAVLDSRERQRAQQEDAAPRARPAAPVLDWQLSGLLLRSPLVAAHKGLEILAWCEGRLLDPLRIERVGDDVLLVLFNGRLDRLEIRPPQEALHFCVDAAQGAAARMRVPAADGSFAGDVLEPEAEGGAAFAARWVATSRSVVVHCKQGDPS